MMRYPGGIATAVLAAATTLFAQAYPSNAEELPAPANKEYAEGMEQRLRDLESQLRAIQEGLEREQTERLLQEAQAEALRPAEFPGGSERNFLDRSRSLQMLNPEITFSADFLAQLVLGDGAFYTGANDRSGMPLREASIMIQHVLDPFSSFRSAINFAPEGGVAVEECYISWSGLLANMTLRVGRFRHQFGVLNRWHEHDLDQTRHPMAMEAVLGYGGLAGDGLALQWLMPPFWADANELVLELVDGSNPVLFSGEHFSLPSGLLHLKSYHDLSPSTYLEWGLTGMLGVNNSRGLLTDAGVVDEPWRRTVAAGADLTISWSPPNQARYLSVLWRSEFFWVDRETLPTPDGHRFLHSWGVMSYLQAQLSERLFLGLRGDLALPSQRPDDSLAWDVVPYLTFWQSEFVYLRLEYQYGSNLPDWTGAPGARIETDHRILFQIDFAAGPHKHEKY